MKPAPFDYLRPDSVDEAVAALRETGEDARILAGGQSLMAMLNMRLARPELVIDIGRLAPLGGIGVRGGQVEIGAGVTQAALLAWPEIGSMLPLLARALPWVGHPQTRNRGTLCGSIAHADPSSELPLCLATLGGEVVLRSTRGVRVLKADEFQTGVLETACAADELIEAVRLPIADVGTGCAFEEFGLRQGDFALVAVAVVARADAITIGIGGMADRPEARTWPMLESDALDDALNEFAWELRGGDDQHASARYRRDLVRTLGRRAVEGALSCRV